MSDALELEAVDPTALSKVAMPPALVEAIQNDPELLVALARGQLSLVQDRMVRKVLNDPHATAAAMAVVHERLSKIARVDGGAAPAGHGGSAQVVINIIRRSGSKGLTIEGQATKVTDGSDVST